VFLSSSREAAEGIKALAQDDTFGWRPYIPLVGAGSVLIIEQLVPDHGVSQSQAPPMHNPLSEHPRLLAHASEAAADTAERNGRAPSALAIKNVPIVTEYLYL
jgi:hypothetical protein